MNVSGMREGEKKDEEGGEKKKKEKHTSYDLAMHTQHPHKNITTHHVLCF